MLSESVECYISQQLPSPRPIIPKRYSHFISNIRGDPEVITSNLQASRPIKKENQNPPQEMPNIVKNQILSRKMYIQHFFVLSKDSYHKSENCHQLYMDIIFSYITDLLIIDYPIERQTTMVTI